ncbi:MAG: alpha/beta fold hydrolase [Rhodocyclaceae bacterium]|nr:MAG: alpha/beta fold hydrolase [Rhodocyclaceae bacterium]
MAAPLVHAQLAWLAHPQELTEAMTRVSGSLWALQWHSWRKLLGLPSEDPLRPHEDDNRFADAVWAESPTWDLVKEWYLVMTHHVQDMLYETPGLSQKERRRAAFWWRKWLNAVAPSNFFWMNPVAMRLAVETKGESLARGFRNFLDDVEAGNIRMTDPSDFTVGQNLATTPGKVVFRNRLLEVLHYTPTKAQVYRTPIVIVTPWINKFYILDLNPRKSMIRYLLDQGFDVFITSWKNPGPEMRDVSFDDYLLEGVQALIDTARGVTGAPKVHAVGYCIGGTALSTYMAWANRHFAPEDVPVSHWTLLTTLVDFHKPGDIEVFIDEGSIRFITQNMERKGYLDGAEMASAFRLLRSNSLIWHYVVHGWLYGETPPPFDVLYWNMDTTRMHFTMHAWYLRELYLHNRLIDKDSLTVAGEPIDLGAITQPVYAVSAEDDHIAPWKQTFRAMNYVGGVKRFVLSSSGHILGIVNPPVKPPKRKFWVGQARRTDTAEGWYEQAEESSGSWWEDWMAWLKPQCGELVDARPVETKAYPALADAPGTYVLEH